MDGHREILLGKRLATRGDAHGRLAGFENELLVAWLCGASSARRGLRRSLAVDVGLRAIG